MSHTRCWAPSTSMYLTPRGDVQACCFNVAHPLGNIREARLPEIWEGARAQRLRDALDLGDFSNGCQACAWSARTGAAPLQEYDQFAPPSRWPKRLELALSNRCNLACIMCHGELSSTIRARRERLAPLPAVYGDQFFDDLAPFLMNAVQVKLLGGEPLLADETYRVLESVITLDAPPACHLTTNATLLPPRALALMERRPLHFAVSIDGWSREVFESIRIGADRSVVMANFLRLRRYCLEAGTTIAMTFSLMRHNWHELLDCLVFAEEHGVRTIVNTVAYPTTSSIWSLPRRNLADLLAALRRSDHLAIGSLDLNRGAWTDTLGRLEARVTSAVDEPVNLLESQVAVRTPPPTRLSALPTWTQSADYLDVDEHETVTRTSATGFLGLGRGEAAGRPLLLALHRLGADAGCEVEVVEQESVATPRTQRIRFVPPAPQITHDPQEIELVTAPVGPGSRRIYARWAPPSPRPEA